MNIESRENEAASVLSRSVEIDDAGIERMGFKVSHPNSHFDLVRDIRSKTVISHIGKPSGDIPDPTFSVPFHSARRRQKSSARDDTEKMLEFFGVC